MGWNLFYLLLAVCPHVALTSIVQEATLLGDWNRGRFILTNYHLVCTLDVDKPIDYLSLTIRVERGFELETWDLELIDERRNGSEVLFQYQTLSTAYPPRYEAHFHLSLRFSEFIPTTCMWDVLTEPLTHVTTTTPQPSTTPSSFSLTTQSGLDVEDACDFVTTNFGVEAPPVLQLPPRGPSRDLPRGRKRRGVGESIYPEVDYTQAMELTLTFYELQRSGRIFRPRLPFGTETLTDWVTTSGLNHVTDDGRDLTGGWYNGNDAIKINLPMAYSVTMMGWGFWTWEGVYDEANLSGELQSTIRWALDYLYKCWDPEANVLYVQVGDIEADRNNWERFDSEANSEMTMEFYKVTEQNPGSDVAAEMAAAFAVGSLISTDPEYSDKMANASTTLYKFARRNRGISTVGNPNAAYPSYNSTEDRDDLCNAAVWLYSLTYDESYLNHAVKYFRGSSSSTADSRLFSWNTKYVACAIHLFFETSELKYQLYVLNFLQSWVNGPVTANGFPDVQEPASLQYIANAALIGIMAIEYEVIDISEFASSVLAWSIKNINRVLGWNPDEQSFLVGYSDKFPQNPHHKNSACPEEPDSCGWGFYNSRAPNTHQLTGALVGGPHGDGTYSDTRQNKQGNSVALDYNAGFHAALAGLQSYRNSLEEQCAQQQNDLQSQFTTTVPTTSTAEMTEMRTRYTTLLPTAPPPMPTTFDYSDALSKSLLFYMAQRGGDVPENYPVTWRKNENTFLGFESGRGGWFDDGSNVKTTVTMASTATLLSWGALKFRTGYEQTDELTSLQGVLRVGLNYLMDCYDDGMFLIQKNVNEANGRGYWLRPSDDIFRFNSPKVTIGVEQYADIAAASSAALVLGSQVFKDSDTEYSATLLQIAEKYYADSLRMQDSYNDTDSVYYSNAGDANDEKCIAAGWLYRATGNSTYITSVINSYTIVRQTDLSWTNQHVLCQIILYETTGQSKYRDAVTYFLRHWMDSGVQYTPQGLAWYAQEGSLRYSANAAFVALLAADAGITPSKSRRWAKSQIDYMLGKNNNAFSYVIGYGDRFPRRPHHRASSCPDKMVPCDWSIYNSPQPNPHVLIGALVSGPDLNDFHEDARTNQTMNRVAVDYNAGFQSAVAGLVQLFPVTLPPPPTTTTVTEKATTTTTTTAKPTTIYNPPTTTANKAPTSLPKVTGKPTAKATTATTTTTTKPITNRPTTRRVTPMPPITTQGSLETTVFQSPFTTDDAVNRSITLASSLTLISIVFMLALCLF